MKLFTPFSIPKKDNCDLLKLKKQIKKVDKYLVDYFKFDLFFS